MTIEEYGHIDSSFNRSLFVSDINRMMQKIYKAISNDDLESIRFFVSDKVYKRYEDMIKRATDNNATIKFDNILIDSTISKIDDSSLEPSIIVRSICTFSKYYYKGDILLSGDDTRLKTIYNLKVCKNVSPKSYYCCSGCGKSYDVIQSIKCPYCGCDFIEEKYNYRIEDVWG